jgi:paired amphipathic helix protein Sin3a
MMCDSSWYAFLRLHQVLCQRLAYVYGRAVAKAEEEEAAGGSKRNGIREATAVAIRLKPTKSEFRVQEWKFLK